MLTDVEKDFLETALDFYINISNEFVGYDEVMSMRKLAEEIKNKILLR